MGAGWALKTRPLSVQFLSFSCSFRQKSYQIIGFWTKPKAWLPPSGKSWICDWNVTLDVPLRTCLLTRMHSSRMRTSHALTVCGHLLLPRGWGGGWSGGSGPRGGLVPGGVCSWGGLVPGGGGSGIPACTEGDTLPPPMDRITDTCKNITLAQLHCGQ